MSMSYTCMECTCTCIHTSVATSVVVVLGSMPKIARMSASCLLKSWKFSPMFSGRMRVWPGLPRVNELRISRVASSTFCKLQT